MDRPDQCPRCRSRAWDKDTFKLKCFRCGHKWIVNEGAGPEAVISCPKCRSRKWNELPPSAECFRCGRLFLQTKNSSLCPVCKGEDFSELRCGLCGAEWIATAGAKKICPKCGLVLSDGDISEKLTVLWERDDVRLSYLFKDAIGCVYLWEAGYPVSCRYLNELLEDKGMEFSTFIKRAGNPRHERFWNAIIEDMESRRDAHLENVQYFKDRLNLSD